MDMKASLLILCMIITFIEAAECYKKKCSIYQTRKLDDNNPEKTQIITKKLDEAIVKRRTTTPITAKNVSGVNRLSKMSRGNRKPTDGRNGGGFGGRISNGRGRGGGRGGRGDGGHVGDGAGDRGYRGNAKKVTEINRLSNVSKKNIEEEDKEITHARKVREFEREMREAILTKGGDGGYTTATYYDGNVD